MTNKTKAKFTETEMVVNYLIPIGHENAITVRELSKAAEIPQREVREVVAELRKEIVILNLQDGKGYFKPLPDEMHLVKKWVAQEESRLKHIGSSLKAGRRAIRGTK